MLEKFSCSEVSGWELASNDSISARSPRRRDAPYLSAPINASSTYVLGLGMDDNTPTATTTTQKVSARSEKVGYTLVRYVEEFLWLRAVFIFYFQNASLAAKIQCILLKT